MSKAISLGFALPLHAIGAGMQVSTALTTLSITSAAALGKSAGELVKSVARDVSRDLSRETITRHCTRNGSRAWIEVRGLESQQDLGRAVLDAMRAHPACNPPG